MLQYISDNVAAKIEFADVIKYTGTEIVGVITQFFQQYLNEK